MWISCPSDTSHVDFEKSLLINFFSFFKIQNGHVFLRHVHLCYLLHFLVIFSLLFDSLHRKWFIGFLLRKKVKFWKLMFCNSQFPDRADALLQVDGIIIWKLVLMRSLVQNCGIYYTLSIWAIISIISPSYRSFRILLKSITYRHRPSWAPPFASPSSFLLSNSSWNSIVGSFWRIILLWQCSDWRVCLLSLDIIHVGILDVCRVNSLQTLVTWWVLDKTLRKLSIRIPIRNLYLFKILFARLIWDQMLILNLISFYHWRLISRIKLPLSSMKLILVSVIYEVSLFSDRSIAYWVCVFRWGKLSEASVKLGLFMKVLILHLVNRFSANKIKLIFT